MPSPNITPCFIGIGKHNWSVQNLYIVQGSGADYVTVRRQVIFRPLSTNEVKVVLLEAGFEEITDQADRSERVLVARKPLGAG
jgi:hypothetical protein